jgi:hypothetical protein
MAQPPGNAGQPPQGDPIVPPSREVLVALGAIIATSPNAAPFVWQHLAETQGQMTLTPPMKQAVAAQVQSVLNRIANAGADQTVQDALATVAKMQPWP